MPTNIRQRYFRLALSVLPLLLALAFPVFSQQPAPAPAAALQQKVAALKQSLAQNQQALRQYTWTETQDMLLKGDSKSKKSSQCKYGPDGKVQKTALSAPPPPKEAARGLKGRIIENKKDEITDYMERVATLIQRYVPPDGQTIQTSFQNGKGSTAPAAGGVVTLTFKDYAKPGDTVTLAIDTTSNQIKSYAVNTYLDKPAEVVTLKVGFMALPDGTNYVAETILDATAKEVQIRTTNSNYRKL